MCRTLGRPCQLKSLRRIISKEPLKPVEERKIKETWENLITKAGNHEGFDFSKYVTVSVLVSSYLSTYVAAMAFHDESKRMNT